MPISRTFSSPISGTILPRRGSFQQNFYLVGNVLHDARGIAFGVVGNILVNQAKVLTCRC